MKTLSKKLKHSEMVPALAFLAPNFIGFGIFTAGAVIFSLIVSFSNWNLQGTVPFRWVGFANFSELIQDQKFWLYFVNTFYLMLGMPIAIAGSLALALLLTKERKSVVVYRTFYFLPNFTAGVAIMILWKALYNPDFGIINTILRTTIHGLGFENFEAPLWLNSTQNIFALAVEKVGFATSNFGIGARDAIIIMGIWTAIGGANMLLYIAALGNVPAELTEAAEIDGAGKWAVFQHVTWPQLAPTTFFIVIMSFIGGLQGGFEQARVMTLGGPAGTTTTLSYYIYNKAFLEFQMGYASAIAWVLFIFIFAITLVNWRFGSNMIND